MQYIKFALLVRHVTKVISLDVCVVWGWGRCGMGHSAVSTPGVISGEELCPSPDIGAFSNNIDSKNKTPQEKSMSKTVAGAKHLFGKGQLTLLSLCAYFQLF